MVMAAQLFLVMQADHPLGDSLRFSLQGIKHLEIGRSSTPEIERKRDSDMLSVRCPDGRMSSAHARIVFRPDGLWLEDLHSKNGTFHNGQRITKTLLQDGDLIEVGHTFFLFRGPRLTWADTHPHPRSALKPELVTFVPALEATWQALFKVSKTDLPALILGESGTGKEVIARAIHAASEREGPFVGVNSGAIPESLIESELFGAVRGAYSGATEARSGLVRAANGGTLFLDEIGELPLMAQVKLLRVLEEREVIPVGGTTPIPVDFQLISATHRDLRHAVKSGDFRQDLYARVSGLEAHLPRLADRKEDLGLLSGALIRQRTESEVRFTRRAVRALFAYDWPSNIRELEKALQLATTLAGSDPIELRHLPESVQKSTARTRTPSVSEAPLSPEDEARKAEILALLETHHGNVTAVAREMGKARMQIHRWMKRYGINPQALRS